MEPTERGGDRETRTGVDYDIIVQGNNLALRDGYLGISSVVLVWGPGGPILFDTGAYGARPALLKGLARHGLKPADVKTVFLSHLHYDHAHNIDLFPEARIVVSRREWEYAENPHPQDLAVPWLMRDALRRHELELIDGDGQLAAGIRYIPAPGHTPGCFALVLDTADKGCVVLAGDALKYAKEAIIRACDAAFDTVEAGTASIGRILDMADRIVPGHFPELRKTDSGFVWDAPAEFPLLVR